jgi:hypothetical protein
MSPELGFDCCLEVKKPFLLNFLRSTFLQPSSDFAEEQQKGKYNNSRKANRGETLNVN